MKTKFTIKVIQLWKIQQRTQASIEFWQEVNALIPLFESDYLTFFSSLFPSTPEAEAWLEASMPNERKDALVKRFGQQRRFGHLVLNDDLLTEWESQLLQVNDGKIHRRFFLKSFGDKTTRTRPYLYQTLKFVFDFYPLTERAKKFLNSWLQKLSETSSIKPKRFKFPWKPLVLGLGLSAIVIVLIYLIVTGFNSAANVNAQIQQNPSTKMASPKEDTSTVTDSNSSSLESQPNQISQNLETPTQEQQPQVNAAREQALRNESPRQQSSPLTRITKTYEVKTGDVLWRIAQEQLGSSTSWPKILELNSDRLLNPDYILPGWVLVLPEP